MIMTHSEANKRPSWVRFDQALEEDHSFVTTLKSPVFRGNRSLTKTKVDQWVTEVFDSEHDILDFHMASGRTLRLTPNHGVVTVDGRIKLAKDFKVGESLVMSDRSLDPIAKIEQTKHFGKVYNVFVKSAALHHNVVLVNGYLVGTGFFQNDGAEFVNNRILENRLLKGVFKGNK
jgi:intein/homing endonuclease